MCEKTSYKKVMVVDDNEIDHYIADRNIRKYCFAKEIISKVSASSALEYLLSLEKTPEELPNLIFLDIRMPEMDGFGFLEKYESFSEIIKNNCTVVMLSTSLDTDDHARAKNNRHVSRFLNKPLNEEKLLTVSAISTIAAL